MKRQFNKNQSLAVNHGGGPCLVLAGPGSGKTFVLTNRILNLIVNNGVLPENILIITFTRAAANEMKERFANLLKEDGVRVNEFPTFGTFHSVFFEILKESFAYNSESLISEQDERRLLFNVLEKKKELKITSDILNNILKDIKSYKSAREREESYKPKYVSRKLFDEIYNEYSDILFNNKKLDFHDMIDKCYDLLKNNNKELNYYQDKFKYVLIDEFQDINKSQYELVKLICKSKNIFVVGDDDQSIYKFRGSRPRVMKDFLNDFSKAQIITLSENYRCAKKIVKFSKLVIDNNVERFEKDLTANRKELGNIEIKAFVDSVEENTYIVEKIRKYVKSGLKFSDIAILYRTNILSNAIKKDLKRYNIPFTVKGEEKKIYDNFAIKDVLAYLKLAINNDDSESLLCIANKPLRYISRDSIGYKNSSIKDVINYYKNKDFMYAYLSKFNYDLNVISKEITALAIRYIRTNIGYDEYLKKYCIEKDIDYDEIMDLLDSFEEEAIGHNDISEFVNYIEHYDDNSTSKVESSDSIRLMTFHLSKGLEFKVVFIIDANDGLIPHKKSLRENDIETERRLFYVAMTRAKDNLHIFFTIRRFGKNFKASRFIIEAVGGQNG